MENKTSFDLEKYLKKDQEKIEDFSLTKEAKIQNKTKWELFLEGYKSYYNEDFSWPKYIKDCKLYYGEFNIHDFINTYGPDCEEDFKRFRNQLLIKKGINKTATKSVPNLETNRLNDSKIDTKLLGLMTEADAIRTRLLIRFLNPQNKIEKKNLKRSWKLAKRTGLSKDEWMKSYVGISFTRNKIDVLDDKYTREELFEILRTIRAKVLNNLSSMNEGNKKISELKKPINDFKKETIKEDDQKDDNNMLEKISTTKLFDEFEKEKNEIQNIKNESFRSFKADEQEKPKKPFKTSDINEPIESFKIKNDDEHESPLKSVESKEKLVYEIRPSTRDLESNFLVTDLQKIDDQLFQVKENDGATKITDFEPAIDFEKHVDDQINSIKQDREFISQELKKVNQIKLAEERRYERLRQERQRLTKDLEDEELFSIDDNYNNDEEEF